MISKLPALIVLGIIAVVAGNALQESIDVGRLQGILQEGLKSQDISSLYYAVKGLKQLNAKIPNICEDIKNTKYDSKNVEQVFQLTNAAALSNCLSVLKPEVLSTPIQTLEKKDATIPELYHAVYSMKAMGKGTIYDKEDALKNLIQLLKKDDSPINYGYVFQLCEHMGCTAWSAAHAEGVLLAAEESDTRARHFEGGLPVTAPLLATIARSYSRQQKPAPFTPEQLVKFASYLVSRRSVTSPRGAALLLEGALAVADHENTPLVIRIKGRKYITWDSDTVEVSVSDVVGRAARAGAGAGDVVAQSGTRLADDVVVLAKQPLPVKPGEPTVYLLNLSKIKSMYGVYRVVVRAGAWSRTVSVSVLGALAWGGAEAGVGDADGTSPPRAHTLAAPARWPGGLAADHAQKLTIKFSVRDQNKKPVTVQQAFVTLTAVGDEARETVFVAEPDTTNTYKVDLNVGAIGKHVGHVSGVYRVALLAGDSAAAAPLLWPLGDIALNFGNAVGSPEASPPRRPAAALPEISHQFRVAEPRPPRLVSDVFALLCAAPLLLLLLLWARLRVNLRALPLTLSAPLFHLGLGGSLGLYLVLWLRLSMFETMRYLLPLALVTFLSGHRLLRRLVSDKHDKR